MNSQTPIIQVNNEDAILDPAYIGDAGYDIIASSNPKIVGRKASKNLYYDIQYIEYDTDLIIAPSKSFHTYVFPRSSISKTNLLLANSVAVIDNGYRGTIKLRFKYVFQPIDFVITNDDIAGEVDFSKIYKKGDRIGQLVFSPTTLARIIPNLKITDESCAEISTERGEGGFGSSGS